MTVQDATFDVADALGGDFVYLAPPGPARFDPATVAVVLGGLLLRAVFKGIGDGVEEVAKDATVSLLHRVADAVRGRLPEALGRAFQRDDQATVTDVQQEAETAAQQARVATTGLSAAEVAGLAQQISSTIQAELAGDGLPAASARRVAATIQVTVTTTLAVAPG
jgi:hypothetical protein